MSLRRLKLSTTKGSSVPEEEDFKETKYSHTDWEVCSLISLRPTLLETFCGHLCFQNIQCLLPLSFYFVLLHTVSKFYSLMSMYF